MAYQKQWEELQIADDFIFGKVMQKPELCKELLERILEIKIDHVEYPELQKTIDIAADARSVRLDVYVRDGKNTVYNIEMQTTNQDDLAKRSRDYQGMIDLNLIEKGMHFRKLPKSYIIFICTFDLFGQGRHQYTFENQCQEDNALRLGDDAIKIFLNATSHEQDISPKLKAFLDYVVGQKSEDVFVQQLDGEVNAIKSNEIWGREYMTLYMRDIENFEQGFEKGVQQGLQEGRLEEQKKIILKLKSVMSASEIASTLDVPLSFVEEIMHKAE